MLEYNAGVEYVLTRGGMVKMFILIQVMVMWKNHCHLQGLGDVSVMMSHEYLNFVSNLTHIKLFIFHSQMKHSGAVVE